MKIVEQEVFELLDDQKFIPSEVLPGKYPNEYLQISNKKTGKSTLIKLSSDLTKWTCLTNKTISGIKARNKEQVFLVDALLDNKITSLAVYGPAGSGKTLISMAYALSGKKKYKRVILTRPMSEVGKYKLGTLPGPQPLNAKILTPTGWTTMGQLKVNDLVVNHKGNPVKIIGIFPKGKKEVYRVTTTDGTCAPCCEDHLWFTTTKEERKRQKTGKVRSLKEISNTLYMPKFVKGRSPFNHSLPRNEAIKFSPQHLPLSPYLLGVLLGDGCFGEQITLSNTDQELLNRVQEILNLQEIEMKKCSGNNINYNLNNHPSNKKPARRIREIDLITGTEVIYSRIGEAIKATGIERNKLNRACKNGKPINNKTYQFLSLEIRWTNTLKETIYKLGLLETNSKTKFVPDIYKFNSIESRLEILRGLMDTDGTIKKKTGESSFCTISLQLAKDVQEIVRSLGGRATICQRDRRNRKKNKINKKIIIPRHVSYEFTISLPKKFNPFWIQRKAKYWEQKYIFHQWIKKIESIGEQETQCILIDDPDHLYITNDFLVTHNTTIEKFGPYLVNYTTNLGCLMPGRKLEDLMHHMDIDIVPIQLMRGASFMDCLILADEVQVLAKPEMLTIGTRVGENSKIILMGDLDQRDDRIKREDTGLYHLIHSEKFQQSPLTATIELKQIERSPTAALFADVFKGID